jgi:hypothetical protein
LARPLTPQCRPEQALVPVAEMLGWEAEGKFDLSANEEFHYV